MVLEKNYKKIINYIKNPGINQELMYKLLPLINFGDNILEFETNYGEYIL